jgi:hypothetical protein
MGNYRQAIHGYQYGVDPTPDITAYRRQGRHHTAKNLESRL